MPASWAPRALFAAALVYSLFGRARVAEAAEEGTSLEAAFKAFAECASDPTKSKLEERLEFFRAAGLRSEDEVRQLPRHQALNEREQVLALQDSVLPPGTQVMLRGLTSRTELNDCDATIISCLRDGSFRCAAELGAGCSDSPEDAQDRGPSPLAAVRVRVENLRPALDCGSVAHDAESACPEDDVLREAARRTELPLTDVAMGRVMVGAVQTHKQLAADGSLPASALEMGASGFPDLPYAAMLMALIEMRWAGCVALRKADLSSAELAVRMGEELEVDARPVGRDLFELPHAVRAGLASLLALSSAVRLAKGDVEGARAAALTAARLNVSAATSQRKLSIALSDVMVLEPHARAGMRKSEVTRLQRWWQEELLPLDEEEDGALPSAQRQQPRADGVVDGPMDGGRRVEGGQHPAFLSAAFDEWYASLGAEHQQDQWRLLCSQPQSAAIMRDAHRTWCERHGRGAGGDLPAAASVQDEL